MVSSSQSFYCSSYSLLISSTLLCRSYGVLLWEIMTLGNQPYPGRINQEVLQYVTGGGRLDRPEKCPGRMYVSLFILPCVKQLSFYYFLFSYHLMQSCWKRYSSERPHFDQVVTILTNFLGRIKRPGSMYYSDSDSDEGESNLQRQSSGKLPSRTPSIRSGITEPLDCVHYYYQSIIALRYSEPCSIGKYETSQQSPTTWQYSQKR